jgi:hypothetical protein
MLRRKVAEQKEIAGTVILQQEAAEFCTDFQHQRFHSGGKTIAVRCASGCRRSADGANQYLPTGHTMRSGYYLR